MKDAILNYFGITKTDIENAQNFFEISDKLELKLDKNEEKILSLYINNINTYDISTYLKIDEVKIYQTLQKIKKENKIKNDKELIKKFKKLHSYMKKAKKEMENYKQPKEFEYNNELLNIYLLGQKTIKKEDIEDKEEIIYIKDEDIIKKYGLD